MTDYGSSDSSTVIIESGCPVEGDGSAEDCPGTDCAKILADGYSTGDGNYWIDPQSDGSAYEVYCLMDSRTLSCLVFSTLSMFCSGFSSCSSFVRLVPPGSIPKQLGFGFWFGSQV